MTHDRPSRHYSTHPFRYWYAVAWRKMGKPTGVFRLYVYVFTIGVLVLVGSGKLP